MDDAFNITPPSAIARREMSETIPKDIMAAATGVISTLCTSGRPLAQYVIACAILAERERCAKIAASHYDLRHGDKARYAGANIAAIIRTPSTGEET